MLLHWNIRYLDTRDRQFKDRVLWLDTDQLAPATRSAIELCHELDDARGGRGILLFEERAYSEEELQQLSSHHRQFGSVYVHEYFEDENGRGLTPREMAAALTGRRNAVLVPSGTSQHTVDYMLSDRRPIPIEQVSLSDEQLSVLGYFTRDLREILASAFRRQGPGTLSWQGKSEPVLKTAVTDEQIRSFVTIFRRLYMTGRNDKANFLAAVEVFCGATAGYPLSDWVKGVAEEYKEQLEEPPYFPPLIKRGSRPFTRKRLIDVYLYTRYAHQPSPQRTRQYEDCLEAFGSNPSALFWLFLSELQHCTNHMISAGRMIAGFVERYCQHHDNAPKLIDSVSAENPGLATLETREAREARILEQKAAELAHATWEENNRPPGGPEQFNAEARKQLHQSKGDSGAFI